MTKRTFQTPVLRKHGSVGTVTQQNRTGSFLDFAFQAGTPVSQITLS